MGEKEELIRIKKALQNNIGKKVRLTARKGRKKSIVRQGIIEETFPSIFIVKLEGTLGQSGVSRRVSYSYTDILTKAIEVARC
jgi:uncharacterized protein Veg